MDPDNPLVKTRAEINPYRWAAIAIFYRLLWDLSPKSWISRKRIRVYRDKYVGRKAVILCNGPSLLKVDFEQLSSSNVFVFGLNKINLIFDKTNLRPDFIVAVNPLVIEQNRDFYNQTDLPLFLSSIGTKKGIHFRKNSVYLHSSSIPAFSRDCSFSINEGHTVTFVALQLAFHMGFSEVALVGADHNFKTKGPANKLVISEQIDLDHFDPNYFADGTKWHLPDLFESEIWFGRARNVFEAFGRKVFNATDGGKLEVFDRVTLEQFLKTES